MKNVEFSVEGNILNIKIDLSKEFGPSSSGKNIIVASTEGNVTIPNREEKIGLNVYRKKQAKTVSNGYEKDTVVSLKGCYHCHEILQLSRKKDAG